MVHTDVDMSGRALELRPVDWTRLFEPKRVVVIGATDTEGTQQRAQFTQTRERLGARGADVVPVHPTKSEILGTKAYPSIADVPGEVRPLVDEVNDLMSRLKRTFDFQNRFVADAAHQLKTPVSGLKAQIELALRESDPERVRHSLAQLYVSADRLSRLVRQLSKSPCIEGQTWNSQPGLITVWKGCRAEFAPGRGGWGGGGNANDYSVTCSSVEGRTVTCAWNARYGQPRLIQQLSRAACVEGRTWGRQGRSAIWVSGGCRGRFGTY